MSDIERIAFYRALHDWLHSRSNEPPLKFYPALFEFLRDHINPATNVTCLEFFRELSDFIHQRLGWTDGP